MALLLGPLRHVHAGPSPEDDHRPATYREILRQPAVRWLSAASRSSGCSSATARWRPGFPAFARQVAEVSTRTIGCRLRGQHRGHRRAAVPGAVADRGHRRTRVMLVMGRRVGGWRGWSSGRRARSPALLIAALGVLRSWAVRASGETMLQPTIPAIDQRPRLRPQPRPLQRPVVRLLPAAASPAPWSRASCCATTRRSPSS